MEVALPAQRFAGWSHTEVSHGADSQGCATPAEALRETALIMTSEYQHATLEALALPGRSAIDRPPFARQT